jgi:hypothetical protein
MRLVVAIALVQVLNWVPTAHAEGNQDGVSAESNKNAARAEWRQGNVAYNLGHFDDAAKHFEAAYKLVQDPASLFNIAQSYRMGGKLDQALDLYRAFLRTTSADAPNRDTAERFVQAVKRKLEKRKGAAPIAPPEAVPAKKPTPAPLTMPTPPAVATPVETPAAGSSSATPLPVAPIAVPIPLPTSPLPTSPLPTSPLPTSPLPASPSTFERTDLVSQASTQEPPSPASWKRWAPWAGVGVTAALGVATIVEWISAKSTFSDLQGSCGKTRSCTDSQVDGDKSKVTTTNVLLGLTAASAAATGVFFYINYSGGKEAGASLAWGY